MMSEEALRALLERVYGEGFDSGVDAVSMDGGFERALKVDRMDVEARDDLIEHVMSDV